MMVSFSLAEKTDANVLLTDMLFTHRVKRDVNLKRDVPFSKVAQPPPKAKQSAEVTSVGMYRQSYRYMVPPS
jgi:hypothetical protein